MSKQIFTWISPVWLAVLLFLIGWIAAGVVAGILLKRGSILAFIPAGAFGFGGYLVVEAQLSEGAASSGVVSIIPVLVGAFCILVLFLTYGRRSPQKEEELTKEGE